MASVRTTLSLSALLGAVALTSCIHTGFTPTTGLYLPPRADSCYLDMIFQGPPPYPYVVIGQVQTDSTAPGLFALGESNDVAVQRMKVEACRRGAHGLLQVAANSQGVWTGNGYSKSTSGGAVAFIYVDPTGQPLPPPNAPRIVIQQGAYPQSQPNPWQQPPPGTYQQPPSAAAPAPGTYPPPPAAPPPAEAATANDPPY
jgi:hypothetical protein